MEEAAGVREAWDSQLLLLVLCATPAVGLQCVCVCLLGPSTLQNNRSSLVNAKMVCQSPGTARSKKNNSPIILCVCNFRTVPYLNMPHGNDEFKQG